MGNNAQDASLAGEELKQREAEAITKLAELRALFPEAHGLARDDRRLSQGRLGLDEAEALRGIIDAMAALPPMFASLADEDDGRDPTLLETDLLRSRLDQHAVYVGLADKLGEVARIFSDAALVIAAEVKPVVLAGYAIAKPLSKRDETIRSKIAKALDLYGGRSAASAAARRANAGRGRPAGK